MSKIKKILLMCTAYVLVAAVAIGGTLAYLTSKDSDVNVMTIGNVKIEQIEQQYDENGNLVPFEQDKPLYPYVGTLGWKNTDKDNGAYRQFTMNNVVDKYVSVKNTGKSDAYVRTLIAFEMGDFTYDEFTKIGISINLENGSEFSFAGAWNIANDFVEEIDGYKYNVMEFVHSAPVKPGETTVPSLLQVYLSKDATNEDVERLDGNGNGKYDIIVISQAVQSAGFEDANDALQRNATTYAAAKTALDTSFGAPEERSEETGVSLCAEWLGDAVEAYESTLIDKWDGTTDTTWYNDTDTTFTLTSAEQLAGLAELVDAGNTFAGKTVILAKSVDLYALDENGGRVLFEPIGDASNADFSGVFDGNNKTIFNLRQDCNSKHVALFGAVYEGTVKNLVLDGAIIENDGSGYAGGIAAYTGASNFENITLRNTTVVNYNHNTGGIVAWCSNNGTTTTFDGINIEDTTTIGSWWGSYDTRVGGVVGAMNTGNYVVIKNSKIACKLDVYNDATSNYQWYNYRTCGMVVADVRDNHTVNGRTEANPARVTCENVEVIFGDWANYHYCEDASYGTPSYADAGEYKFRRVEAGLGYGGIDLSACDHDADETHNELIAFDCLFGARDGKGIYSINAFDGVTVIYN